MQIHWRRGLLATAVDPEAPERNPVVEVVGLNSNKGVKTQRGDQARATEFNLYGTPEDLSDNLASQGLRQGFVLIKKQ